MPEKLTLKQKALRLLPQLMKLELNLADDKLSDQTKFSLMVQSAAALYQSSLSSEEDSKEDDDVMIKVNLETIFHHVYHYINNKSIDVNSDHLDLIEKWERPSSEMPAVNGNPTFSYTEEEKAKLDFFRQEKYGVLLRSAQNSIFFGSRKVYLGPKGITLMDKKIGGIHEYSSVPSQQLQYVFAAEKQEALTKFVNELVSKFSLSDVDEQVTLLNAIKGEYSVLTAKKLENMGCEDQIYGLHFLMRQKPEATSIVNQWEFSYQVLSAVIAEKIGVSQKDLENDSCIDAIYRHVSVVVDKKIEEIESAKNAFSK